MLVDVELAWPGQYKSIKNMVASWKKKKKIIFVYIMKCDVRELIWFAASAEAAMTSVGWVAGSVNSWRWCL